jgi:hypothetical protein
MGVAAAGHAVRVSKRMFVQRMPGDIGTARPSLHPITPTNAQPNPHMETMVEVESSRSWETIIMAEALVFSNKRGCRGVATGRADPYKIGDAVRHACRTGVSDPQRPAGPHVSQFTNISVDDSARGRPPSCLVVLLMD